MPWIHLVIAQGQGGHEALLLLPVQPLQCTVVFLRDAAHREDIVFQPLAGGGKFTTVNVRRNIRSLRDWRSARSSAASFENVIRSGASVRVMPGPHRLSLFFHFHFANVRDFP